MHQGYIEPHACVAQYAADGQVQIYCSSQGQFMVRAYVAKLLGIDISEIRVTPLEIGGGFGGKTLVYLEPLAVVLSRKSGRPVKMVMSREEVFRGSGPTSGGTVWVRIGATRDGKMVAGDSVLKYQAGAYAGSPVGPGCMTAFAMYDLQDVRITGYDVVTNRPKVAAYRAPGAPISTFGVESAVDELARELGMDPVELRLKNAAKKGTKAAYGPTFGDIGYVETLEAVKNHPNYQQPLGPNQGRGVASGFWFNIGGESSATVNINEDGTAVVATGNPDIGGSRASMAMMAAEVLGIEVDRVRPIVADTSSVGYCFLTGGSRVTFATGMAVVEASRSVIAELKARAAKTWDIPVEAVEWRDGEAVPAGSNAGDFEPLSLADLAAKSGRTGGPITGKSSINAQGAGPGFGTHLVDVEVDRETGHVKVLRYLATQDAGRAIHPSYVEGQIQGGAVQGIGWALNEEYIYDEQGRLGESGLPRLSHPRGVGPADDRHGGRGGAEPEASLRRARRRRGADRAAHGRHGERDSGRDRRASDRTAHVAAQGPQGGGRHGGGGISAGLGAHRSHPLGLPPLYGWHGRARVRRRQHPRPGARPGNPLSGSRPPGGGKHGRRHRRCDAPGRPHRPHPPRRRSLSPPPHRRRLKAEFIYSVPAGFGASASFKSRNRASALSSRPPCALRDLRFRVSSTAAFMSSSAETFCLP